MNCPICKRKSERIFSGGKFSIVLLFECWADGNARTDPCDAAAIYRCPQGHKFYVPSKDKPEERVE